MKPISIGARPWPTTTETRARFWFSALTVLTTVLLIGWGGFVTSIDAGMAVPDWPTTFGSYDPLATGYLDPADPSKKWWNHLPTLAEHGHRVLGMIVGLLTIGLAGWTVWKDDRRWMKGLAVGALVLVIVQGVLGGLRVVFDSLDLAMVHACTAQIYFSLIVALTLFVSKTWRGAEGRPSVEAPTEKLRRLAVAVPAALYLQIVLGALLRHEGTGVHALFAGIHLTGAFVVTGLVVWLGAVVYKHFWEARPLRRAAQVQLGLLTVQFALGLAAYVVLLYETGEALRSISQVALTVAHLVTGALLMAASVATALLALRQPETDSEVDPAHAGDGEAAEIEPVFS